jgi:hypothetical protein
LAEQVFPQLIPAGELVTVPLPDAPTMSVWVWVWVGWLNVAVTAVSEVSVTLHEPVPVHAPLHPVKVELVAVRAVRVTALP